MVIPMFYDRSIDGLPRAWIAKMRRSMTVIGEHFSAQRMVAEYHGNLYEPALAHARRLRDSGYRDAVELAGHLQRLHHHWPGIAVEQLDSDSSATLEVGDSLDVTARVRLGGLEPSDVQVALYHGAAARQHRPAARRRRDRRRPEHADGVDRTARGVGDLPRQHGVPDDGEGGRDGACDARPSLPAPSLRAGAVPPGMTRPVENVGMPMGYGWSVARMEP